MSTSFENSIAYDLFKQHGIDALQVGWPDLLVTHNDVLHFVELKGGTDGLRPEQLRMHAVLRKAGHKVHVVHHGINEPAEFVSLRILELVEGREKNGVKPVSDEADVKALSLPQAARVLGIGSTKLGQLIASGELHAVNIGRRRLVLNEDITEYLAKLRVRNRNRL